MSYSRRDLARFWSKAVFLVNGCVERTDRVSKNGYATFGYFDDGGRHTVLAHRFIFEHVHGKLPTSIDVMHSCDNRGCIALRHLSSGTRKHNMEDAVAKGRHSHGVDRPGAKLDADKVRRARSMLVEGQSQQAVADHLGVHQVAISLIVRGKTWKHVK